MNFQGASAALEEFYLKFGTILDAMLRAKSQPLVGEPCGCGQPNAIRKCHCYDCHHFEPCCPECFIKKHQLQPLHWVQLWNRRFFEKKDLSRLGHVITYGHDLLGGSCPNSTQSYDFTIVDVNGLHETRAAFCQCLGRNVGRFDHLINSQVFPATTKQPQTGFTFNLLDDFHQHTLTSKKSPYDYLSAVRQKTSCTFLDDVPVIDSLYVCCILLTNLLYRILIHSFCEFNVSGELSKPSREVDKRTVLMNFSHFVGRVAWLCLVLHALSLASTCLMISGKVLTRSFSKFLGT